MRFNKQQAKVALGTALVMSIFMLLMGVKPWIVAAYVILWPLAWGLIAGKLLR